MKLSRKPMRSKALLAIAFAGGFLYAQLPALAESKNDSPDSIIQQIAGNVHEKPEVRAFHLLGLARACISGDSRAQIAAHFSYATNQSSGPWLFRNWQGILGSWTDMAALEGRTSNSAKIKTGTGSDSRSSSDEKFILANSAIQEALKQTDQASNTFAKLHLYFIASRLYQRLGNIAGMKQCNQVVDKAIQNCESSSSVDEEQIKAVASIFNSMAYGLIPLRIEDNRSPGQKPPGPFTEEEFKASEKLKLRAAAVMDRLSTTDHLRRKTHRDLALWYTVLGKLVMAEQQKLMLFFLVGSMDNKLLYPQTGACGHLIWWEPEQAPSAMSCGMG